MAEPPSIDAAQRRLAAALEALESAVERRRLREGRSAGLSVQLKALSEDRLKLAEALDAQNAHAAKLDQVNREVSRRLGAAMETIRDVLDSHER